MKQSKQDKFIDESDRIRGMIINLTINLERTMDDYISKYFCKDIQKRKELLELIICDRIDFSKKTEVLIQILKKKCNQDDKIFKKEYPSMASDFQQIAKDRNFFAHNLSSPFPAKSDIETYSMSFFKFSNEFEIKGLTELQIAEIINRLDKYRKLIFKLEKV